MMQEQDRSNITDFIGMSIKKAPAARASQFSSNILWTSLQLLIIFFFGESHRLIFEAWYRCGSWTAVQYLSLDEDYGVPRSKAPRRSHG